MVQILTFGLLASASLVAVLNGASTTLAAEVRVDGDAALRSALGTAKPGDVVRVAPGRYAGVSARDLRGEADRPIVIQAAKAEDPPVFVGPKVGIHLSRCEHVVLRDLAVRGAENNGVNVDDGGDAARPSHHVVLERVTVAGVGGKGNHDAFKLSGVTDFAVRDSAADGWGGSGIDMVGCHRGVVENCTFKNHDDRHQANGVQMKGGSSDIAVRRCTFLRPGGRGVNVGGSTGLAYFRPADAPHEAKGLTVEGCRFVGGDAAVSFVGVDGAVVRYNTIYSPGRWAVRILQENQDPRFAPCRNGRFEKNVVVFESAVVRQVVNVGGGTKPETFTFAGNVWYAKDNPGRSRPQLPVGERGGVYGVDPSLKAPERDDLTAPRAGPTVDAGADALPEGAPEKQPHPGMVTSGDHAGTQR